MAEVEAAVSALILEQCQIIHIPKCGGKWVQRALEAGGVRFTEWHIAHDPRPHPDLPIVTFVRHPLTWWQSLWRYWMERDGKIPFRIGAFDLAPLFRGEFNAFMEAVLRARPGYCSWLFEEFTGPPDGEIGFIGKQEMLAADLLRALERFGVEHDAGRIATTLPYHVTDKRFRADYRAEVGARVLDAERGAVTRYGYA